MQKLQSETSKIETNDDISSIDYSGKIMVSVKSLPERMVSWMKTPPYLSWLIIGVFYFSWLFIVENIVEDVAYVGTQIAFSLFITLLGSGLIWYSRLFERFFLSLNSFVELPNGKLLAWYKHRLRLIFENKRTPIFGIIVAILLIVTINFIGLPFKTRLIRILDSLNMGFLGFVGGITAYFFITSTQLLFEISRMQIKISIHQHPLTSVKALGTLYFKIAVYSTFAYITALIAFRFGPYGLTPIFLSWLGIPGIVILGWFIIPQIRVHTMMVEAKENKVRRISHAIEKVFDEASNNPTKENLFHLKEILELDDHFANISEWPFNTRMLLTILTAVLGPLILAMVELIMR